MTHAQSLSLDDLDRIESCIWSIKREIERIEHSGADFRSLLIIRTAADNALRHIEADKRYPLTQGKA